MYWTGRLQPSFPNYHPCNQTLSQGCPGFPWQPGLRCVLVEQDYLQSRRQGQAGHMRPLGSGDNWSVSSGKHGVSRHVWCAGGSTQVCHGTKRSCNPAARLCPRAPHLLQPCVSQPFLREADVHLLRGKKCPSQSLPKALSRASPWGSLSLGVNKTYCDLSRCPLLHRTPVPLITASRSSDPQEGQTASLDGPAQWEARVHTEWPGQTD